MTLQEMIYCRKSCRSYTGKPVDEATLETIKSFPMKPLYPDIKIFWDIIPRSRVKCICPWTTPQVITVYSEEKEGYLENIGFMFQQMDLYLQTLGLGVCWLGLGQMNPKNSEPMVGMKHVMMLAFGHPKGDQLRHSLKEFKRKPMDAVSDRNDPRLEPARLAPSGVNLQHWYFVHEGDTIHVYCSKKGGRLDTGIAISHLYVTNEETFRFFQVDDMADLPGYGYVGSVTLS